MLAALCMLSAQAAASGTEKLRRFVETAGSAKGEFSQTVLDRSGRTVQSASGTMEFVRPGRFRWSYAKPYEQIIVGDGERLWIFDADLNQATVRKLDAAIGSSPAALLAGRNELETYFSLSDAGSAGGLEWVEAVPKAREAGFERVRMGFDGEARLAAMELKDHFGQTTLLKFPALRLNAEIPAERFRFTPPPGADVIRD